MIVAQMNTASEVRPFSVMKQTRKRYNNLFKAQVIKNHLNGAKFEDLAKQYGPCDDSIRRWVSLYLSGLLTLPGLDPVPPKHDATPVGLKSAETFISLMGQHSTGSIELSFKRSGLDLDVKWPVSNAMECAQLIKELLQ
jgi:transposase-like protein